MGVEMDFLPFTRPSIDDAEIRAVGEVLRSGWITSGPKVREFEAALSKRYGGRPVRVLNSATAALELQVATSPAARSTGSAAALAGAPA